MALRHVDKGIGDMARRLVEYTPLLGLGYHVMTLDDLHSIAVRGLPDESRRAELFAKLQRFADELEGRCIACDLWIDGSFLTEAPDPNDIDIAVRVMDDVMTNLNEEQLIFVDLVAQDDQAYVSGLDTFVFAGYWIGHPLYGTEADDGASKAVLTWGHQFGKGQDDWLKGIVIVPVMETELGLRLRR